MGVSDCRSDSAADTVIAGRHFTRLLVWESGGGQGFAGGSVNLWPDRHRYRILLLGVSACADYCDYGPVDF